MTPSEAVQKAMDGHEFRNYAPATPLQQTTPGLMGVVAVCWCGTHTPPFLSERAARDAHDRHQARLALMRSFGHWDI